MTTAALTHLLYLHGFRSSPRSFKAQSLAGVVQQRAAQGLSAPQWACPQLPPSPAAAWQLIEDTVQGWPADTSAVVGSSLGGFYATVVAQRLGWRAAVINPAMAPARDLARYIGEQHTFDDPQDRFFVQPGFMAEFEALSPYPITRPARYWALIAQGDEVLDWQEMLGAYGGDRVRLIEGSDHAISDFDLYMPEILQFLGWETQAHR